MITIIYSTHKDSNYNKSFKDHLTKSIGIKNFEIKDVYAILNEIHQQNSQEIKVVKCVDCTSVNISIQGDSINEQFSVVGISFDRQEMTLGKISKNLEGLIGRLDSIHCWSPAELEKGKSKLLEESGTVGN